MKRITILIISLIFSFKIASAQVAPAINVLSEINNSKDYSFVKKYLSDENDELKIVSMYVLVNIDKNSACIDLKNIYNSSSYEVKRNIIYVIGETKLNENISFLKDRLDLSEKKDIINEAITALIKINNEEVVQPLLNYLNHAPKNEYLIKAIPVLGDKAVKPLFLNLPDGDEDVFNVTKYIVNEIINENVSAALTEILKLSISEIDPVKRLTKEIIEERREAVLVPAVQLFIKADGKLKEELIRFLSGYSDGGIIVYRLNEVWNELKDDDRKIEAINILNNYKIDAYNEFLLDKFGSSSEKVRNIMLLLMNPKTMFATRFIGKLEQVNDENSKSVYKDAIINLGGGDLDELLSLYGNKNKSGDVEEILIKLNSKNVDEYLLLVSLKIEANFRDKFRNILIKRAPISIETLINGLKNKSKAEECEEILLQIGKQTIPYLINVLKADEDDLQIFEATEIFLRMGKMTVPYLISELKVDDLWIKMNIAEVLVKFKQSEVISSLIEILGTDDPGLQYRAIFGLRDMGSVAVPELIKNLKASEENILIGVVRSLGELRDKTANVFLKEKLVSAQNEKIKAEIEKALKKIGE